MHFFLRAVLFFSPGILCMSSVRADVRLASPFTDHAVLQQGVVVPVWGKAARGERITVTFGGQTLSTQADDSGAWKVSLAPLSASAVPATLVVKGQNTVVLADILVGEVWLGSGQSNMEFPVKWAANAKREVAAAGHPLIRLFRTEKANSPKPQETLKGEWLVCSPETVADFSATAYYFARDLQRTLEVPVGIIGSSYGGTPVESWMSEDTLASNPGFPAVFERVAKLKEEWPRIVADHAAKTEEWKKAEAAAKAAGRKFGEPRPRAPVGPGHPYMPMMEYNAMIHPLVPYALRGVIWYQGEANTARPSEYLALFSALIAQWRREWDQVLLPFYFVQLAGFQGDEKDPRGHSWAALREAQSRTLSIPGTGMAVAIDIGNSVNVHPANKQDVGNRLARLALARTYGRTDVVDSGPVFAAADFSSDAPAVRVSFQPSCGRLVNDNPSSPGAVLGFELAGADRVFHAADARIENDTVLVRSSAVPSPMAIRYAWRNAPENTLKNGAGLPATPFRSDDWELR